MLENEKCKYFAIYIYVRIYVCVCVCVCTSVIPLFDKGIEIILDTNYIPTSVFESVPIHTIIIAFVSFDSKPFILYFGTVRFKQF